MIKILQPALCCACDTQVEVDEMAKVNDFFCNENELTQNGNSIDDEEEEDVLAGFGALEPDPPERRPTCRTCG